MPLSTESPRSFIINKCLYLVEILIFFVIPSRPNFSFERKAKHIIYIPTFQKHTHEIQIKSILTLYM
jgi:hypothetical protein